MFKKYFKNPTASNLVNSKLILLTTGFDCDFDVLKKVYPNLYKDFKINQIRVSDRHFIKTESKERNWIPDELFLESDGHKSVVKSYYVQGAPLILTAKNKEFALIERNTNQQLPVKVSLVPLYKYTKYKYKGAPLTEFLQVVGQDKISIIPFDGCEHWLDGEQCKFCGANPERLKPKGIKPNVLEIGSKYAGNYQEWWNHSKNNFYESFSKALDMLLKKDKITPHFHLSIISGNLINLDFLWEKCLDLSTIVFKKINRLKIDSYFQLMPPKNLEYVDQVKKLCFKNICFNLETYKEKYFKDVCPGKYRYYGYEKMIEAFKYGVKVFGKGNVRNNFVLGSAPTWVLLEGAKYLAGFGVVTDYSVFFPRPGSVWCQKSPPSPEEILYFSEELVKIYRKYNYRPYCCSLSSRSSIENEYYNGWV